MDSLSQIASQRALSRRDFLRAAVVAGAADLLPSSLRKAPLAQKVVVITFGGGARDEETFAPEGQANIPHLIGDLIPRAAFFTQVVNRGILGHYVANASLATGVYESFDNFADVAPRNPTVFEYFRKELRRPLNDAWVIAPSWGFGHIGQSDGSRIARGLGARVVLPKRLLSSALGSTASLPGNARLILQDNYEDVLFAPPSAQGSDEDAQLVEMLRLSVDDFVRHAAAVSSADELSVYILGHILRQFAPSLLWITLHDMDVAHTGAYSLYLEGIRRTDRLCSQIWQMIESHPEYQGRTTMIILPDFGRDSDLSPGGNGFQHHRTGDALSRTSWMMALGVGVRSNTTVNRPLDSLDLVPTIGRAMGFDTSLARGRPALEIF